MDRSSLPGFRTALLVAALLRAFLACETPTDPESRRGGISGSRGESAQVDFVRHLAREGKPPIPTIPVQDSGSFLRAVPGCGQPPLACIVQAPAWWLGERLSPGSGWLSVRLLNAFLSVLSVAVAASLASRAVPGTGEAVAWMLAIQPGLAYQGSLAGGDPLFWLLSALFLRVVVEVPRQGPAWPLFPLSAALLLTKSSAIVLLPLPILALLPPLADAMRRRRLLPTAIAMGMGIAAAAPWYLHNQVFQHHVLALEACRGAGWDPHGALQSVLDLKSLVPAFLGSLWMPMDPSMGARAVPRVLISVASAAWILPPLVEWSRVRADRSSPLFLATLGLAAIAFVPYAIGCRQSEARIVLHMLPAFTALWAVSVGSRPTRWTWLALAPCLAAWIWIAARFALG